MMEYLIWGGIIVLALAAATVWTWLYWATEANKKAREIFFGSEE